METIHHVVISLAHIQVPEHNCSLSLIVKIKCAYTIRAIMAAFVHTRYGRSAPGDDTSRWTINPISNVAL